jgi:hypothetical protein
MGLVIHKINEPLTASAMVQPVRFTGVSMKGYSSSNLPFYSDGNIEK